MPKEGFMELEARTRRLERGVEQAMKDVLDRAGVAEDGERMENAPLAHKKGSSGIPGSWRLACSATSARWVVV